MFDFSIKGILINELEIFYDKLCVFKCKRILCILFIVIFELINIMRLVLLCYKYRYVIFS